MTRGSKRHDRRRSLTSLTIPSILVGLFLAGLVSVSMPANAQTTAKGKGSAGQLATEVFGEAQKLFDKGKYAEALVGFRQAYNASNSPNARLMVGNCLIALGKNSEAYVEMAETMKDAAARADKEPKYAKTRDSAKTQLTLLEEKIGKVIVHIEEREAEVTVNGVRVAPDKLGTILAVDPGTVTIAAKHVDGRTVFQEKVVTAGKTETIDLVFKSEKTSGGHEPDSSTALKDQGEAPSPSKGGGVRIAGGVVLGLGVAGMALFGIAGFMAKGRFTTLETECGGARCTDAKYADVIDSGKTLTTVANVGLGVGTAGIVAGTLMMMLGGPSKSAAPGVALNVSPHGAHFQYRMTF